ncbi:hypothetical protein [Mitsuokella sp.]
MKVLKGYVSNDCRLYGKGMIFETDDDYAEYLVNEGAAVIVEDDAPAAPKASTPEKKAEAETAKDEEEMTLPDADPAAAVKTSGKK